MSGVHIYPVDSFHIAFLFLLGACRAILWVYYLLSIRIHNRRKVLQMPNAKHISCRGVCCSLHCTSLDV